MMENCLLVHSYGFSLVEELGGRGGTQTSGFRNSIASIFFGGGVCCKTLGHALLTGTERLGDKVFPSACLFADFNISNDF